MPDYADFNQAQYSHNFQQYLNSNISGLVGGGDINSRISLLKEYLPEGRSIIEIGSGGGDEAEALKSAGYVVTASDYVDKFVDILSQRGLHTISFDAKNDNFPFSVDCVYANAVFVHFSIDELAAFLKKIAPKLQNEKIVFLTVIKGVGSERSGRSRGIERDFHYYTPELLSTIAEDNGYKVLHLNATDPKWIQAILVLADK